MQTITAQLEQAFRAAIQAALGFDADPLIGVAQNDKFGDYQSNAAMGLAKQMAASGGSGTGKTNPRAVAEQIKAKLDLGDMTSEISIAGPGFINVRLSPAWLAAHLRAVAADNRLGSPLAVSPQRVVIDYSGPNVAKQMHVGHLRSTIIGDAISRVVEFQGHHVIRQNHIGDWGTQFGMLIAYGKNAGYFFEDGRDIDPAEKEGVPFVVTEGRREAFAEIAALEQFYRDAKRDFDSIPGFQDDARKAVVRLQAGESFEVEAWKHIVDETRKHYVPLYHRLRVRLTLADERGESFYNQFLPEVVKELKGKNLAVESQGATAVFLDGPEKPPVIIEKTGGGFLYATTDLAALRYRARELHADRIIYTHDSRQAQHFDQVFRIARHAGFVPPHVQLDYAPFGTMLGEDGRPFKTRSGDTVKLKDLLDEADGRGYELAKTKEAERIEKLKERGEQVEPLSDAELREIGRAVGIGAVKYSDLSKDRTSDYVFSWDRALAMDGNTAPYLQYAYARIRSIFRKAGIDPTSLHAGSLKLESPYELALAKHVLRLGEAIDLVSRELKPHHLCNYLYELATKFSSFYENCPVLQSEEETRSSRLVLCDVTARTLARGLDLIGIEHPEQM